MKRDQKIARTCFAVSSKRFYCITMGGIKVKDEENAEQHTMMNKLMRRTDQREPGSIVRLVKKVELISINPLRPEQTRKIGS